jgi:nucleotide-binding universal stress UspA family protein
VFEKMIAGIDGSEGGRDAVALATRLLAADGQLILANVRSELPSRYAPLLASIEDEQRSQELLSGERDAAQVSAELVSCHASSPGRGLHVLAEQRGADLIVVGSTSRGALGRIALGDDTRAALNGAPCAVAIATRGYCEHPLPLARIGVGYDASTESEAALARAHAIAAPNRSLLRALRVVTMPTIAVSGVIAASAGETIEALTEEAREQMDALADVDGQAVYGLAEEELVRFSEELDLLVVGSRGYGPIRRMMLGSVCRHLERHSRCSLLVVPRVAAQQVGGNGGDERSGPSPAHSDRR